MLEKKKGIENNWILKELYNTDCATDFKDLHIPSKKALENIKTYYPKLRTKAEISSLMRPIYKSTDERKAIQKVQNLKHDKLAMHMNYSRRSI